MSILRDAFAWLLSPTTWMPEVGPGLADRIGEHLTYSALALLLAVPVGVIAGLIIGHTGKGKTLLVGGSGVLRALPTLGLLTLLALLLPTGISLPLVPTLVVLAILGIPPVLAGAYSGMESVDRTTIDAARAIGLSPSRVLWRIEVPLSLPHIVGGIRSAALQILATATVAAYIGLGGLGRYLLDALSVRDTTTLVGASLAIALMALIIDLVFALLQGLAARQARTGKGR